jgi:hypothetical protein
MYYTISQKGTSILLPIYLRHRLTDFQTFFSIELRSKYTLKQLFYFATNSERVAIISCEIMNCNNDVIFYR